MCCPSLLVKEITRWCYQAVDQTTIKHVDAINIKPSFNNNTTNFTQISTSSISQPVSSNHHDDEDTSTSSTTAALIISSTSLLGLIIVIVIYGLCKYKGNKKKVAASSYENLDQSGLITCLT